MLSTIFKASRLLHIYCLFSLLFAFKNAAQTQTEVAGLTLDELEMLEDFELKQVTTLLQN
jgi:hypothetical protein